MKRSMILAFAMVLGIAGAATTARATQITGTVYCGGAPVGAGIKIAVYITANCNNLHSPPNYCVTTNSSGIYTVIAGGITQGHFCLRKWVQESSEPSCWAARTCVNEKTCGYGATEVTANYLQNPSGVDIFLDDTQPCTGGDGEGIDPDPPIKHQ